MTIHCGKMRPFWNQYLCLACITLLSFHGVMTGTLVSAVSVQLRTDLVADMKIIEDSKMLEVNLTYQGTGRYLGIGWGSSTMAGSDCVIGVPGLTPAKYALTGHSLSGDNRMAKSKQTLQNATWTESDDKTVLSFRKFLVEDGEVSIKTESEIFIWAIGEDEGLVTHKYYGASRVNLLEGSSEKMVVENKKEFILHGLFAFLAWGVFTPLAIAASLLRDYLPIFRGSPLWIKLHFYFNMLSAFTTVVSFALAVNVYQKKEKKLFTSGTHGKIGLFLLISVIFQVLAGILRPSLPKGKYDDVSSSPDVKKNEQTDEEEPKDSDTSLEKSQIRIFWELSHKLLGYGFLAVAIFQVQDGINHYAHTFGAAEGSFQIAFFAWIGSLTVIVTVLKIFKLISP